MTKTWWLPVAIKNFTVTTVTALVSMEALSVDLIIDIVKSAVGVKKEWEEAAPIGSPQSPSWFDGGPCGIW